ncbi:MAG TPA: class I SAM-dependent methyltransferase [Gemmatimonadaceae bacterium]|nr:class I SAM-dependent methyltransferase [Gemmatimonadaceae bacterium]HRQ78377.1 class I SAM-dependent methyltransferase [Gemmatimonadaceae bacterium]
MDSQEYDNLERVEATHWYYAAKRAFVRDWILRTQPPAADDELLDCGAGTGRFALEMQAYCRTRVLDDHEESLSRLRLRFPADRVHALEGGRIPLVDGAVRYLTALDVLEHIADDASAVAEFARVLAPGGLCVATVPADPALWSDWDVHLHHHRRYRRPQLRQLFSGPAWEILHVNYTNVLAYPAVRAVRAWRRRFPAAAGAARAEDRIPSAPVNALLRESFRALAMSRLPFPFGVSLLLVARRTAAPA